MFNRTRAVMATMKAQRYGRILSLSSMSWRGNFGQANYAAAKAGVVRMARTVALEEAPYGIIADAAAYLCADSAGCVTGVVLDVDGGIGIGSSAR